MATGESLFGTDGIRGRVGVEPVTPAFAYQLGRVLAAHTHGSNALICIGRDTRESSLALEASLMQGILDGGVQVESLGLLSTPGISYCTKHGASSYGIAITASHNPFEYNGFKLFSSDGTKLDQKTERLLERELSQPERRSSGVQVGTVEVSSSSRSRYLDLVRDRAAQIGSTGLTGVVDCANGATTEIAATVFDPVFENLHVIGNTPNGTNINKDVGATSVATLQRSVRDLSADIGITFDGDGDRVLFVDDEGGLVDGDKILYLLARRHLTSDQSRGGVVGTIMSNHGLQLALGEIDVPFVRTDVGDKYVYDELMSRQWRLGGEPSGHLIWRDVTDTGDGILIGLSVLEATQATGSSLRELVAPVTMLPQAQRNVPSSNPQALLKSERVRDLVSASTARIEPEGRLLVRASGTEPLVRVMVEHQQADIAARFADELANAIDAAS